jgi:hypothetical protein
LSQNGYGALYVHMYILYRCVLKIYIYIYIYIYTSYMML